MRRKSVPKKQGLQIPQKRKKELTVLAKCSGFNIQVSALIDTKGLSKEDSDNVKRKLTDKVTKAIASLPFSFTYPHEMEIK